MTQPTEPPAVLHTPAPPDAALVALEGATITELRRRVALAARRVAAYGDWPQDVDPLALVARLPEYHPDGTCTPGKGGFDAGIACALDLIPRPVQYLAAGLHAAYTPSLVDQVRNEITTLNPDSATAWWLAACSVCTEGPVAAAQFFAQCEQFENLAHNRAARLEAATTALEEMRRSFDVRDGVAWATRDGGMQGAYLAGHHLAVQHAERYGLYFIGTYLPTLGLEDFTWAHPADPDAVDLEDRLGRSGPVFGSTQFVKCCDLAELHRALEAVHPA